MSHSHPPARDSSGAVVGQVPEEVATPDVHELAMAFENLIALVDLYESLMEGQELFDYDSRCLIEEARVVAEVDMLRECIPSLLVELERATRRPAEALVRTGSR